LDARLRALESRVERPEDEPTEAAAADERSAIPSIEKRNENSRLAEERFSQMVATHERSPVDAAWASTASRTYQGDLDERQRRFNFRAGPVECRSSSCVAEVEWDSYAEAQRTFHTLVGFPTEMTCQSHISIPEPEDMTLVYKSKVLFTNCRD
jgi:hypothetical protein